MTQLLLPPQIETLIQQLYGNITKVICGKRNTVDKVIMAFMAGGHVLLDDVPGVGKTLLAKTIAKSINAEYKRIQCTPDLLPSDITGVSIFNPADREFKFIPGPVFTNVLLVDEINRAAPRTQSCLLEAMEESQLTIEGKTYKLQKPFLIIATQNPIEYHGTFELPEAQLDRFLVVLRLGYPNETEEDNILCHYLNENSTKIDPVINVEDYMMLHEYVKNITVSEDIRKYIIDISNSTREDPAIRLGVSPRGSLALLRMAQAAALIDKRNYVIPDDVKLVAVDTLSHRIIPVQRKGLLANNQLITEIMSRIRVPG
jgi:MoxR-like ATPase